MNAAFHYKSDGHDVHRFCGAVSAILTFTRRTAKERLDLITEEFKAYEAAETHREVLRAEYSKCPHDYFDPKDCRRCTPEGASK